MSRNWADLQFKVFYLNSAPFVVKYTVKWLEYNIILVYRANTWVLYIIATIAKMNAGQHIQQRRANTENVMKLFGLATYRCSAVMRVWVWTCVGYMHVFKQKMSMINPNVWVCTVHTQITTTLTWWQFTKPKTVGFFEVTILEMRVLHCLPTHALSLSLTLSGYNSCIYI